MRRILEIGSWQGGTMRVWLTQSPEIVVAVDLDHQREEMYERWRSSATLLEVITGDSLSDEVKERVRKLVAAEPSGERFVNKGLGRELRL